MTNQEIIIKPTFDREKEWLILQLRATDDPIQQDIIKVLLNLIEK